nr:helix-turn-helix transcriptional regulator [uncultured Schaedlerella sp.]
MRINRIELTKELIRQDMTQKQLAEKSGISRATVNGIKNGRSCSDSSAIKIADALGIPIELLLEQ